MSDDKMRAEFEKWAKAVGHDLSQTKGDDRYWFVSTESAWESWQAAYQAGQKAEREAILSEFDSVADGYTWQVRMAFNAMAAKIRNKPEGDDE